MLIIHDNIWQRDLVFMRCPLCFLRSQPTQRASPSTSWWASVWASSWRCASWWQASPAGLVAREDLLLPQRGDIWRSQVRNRRMTASQMTMKRRRRSLKWPWGHLRVILAVSLTVPWGAWMCLHQLRSWRRHDVWRRGNGLSGRSGGTGSRTSWSQGRGLLDECITTNRLFDCTCKSTSDCKGKDILSTLEREMFPWKWTAAQCVQY